MNNNKTLWKQARLNLVKGLLHLVKMRPDYIKSLRIGGNTIHLSDEQAIRCLNEIKTDTEAIV